MDAFVAVARALGGIVAGLLPRRLWGRLSDHVPVHATALASAIATAGTGVVVGGTGFLRYAAGVASANNAAMLEIASKQTEGAPGAPVLSSAPMFLTALSGIVFAFTTLPGLVATYLALSGLARVAGAIVDDPFGDPLLTAGDAATTRLWAKRREARAIAERERLEGPEVPDLVVPAIDLGIPEAVWAVVSSRSKEGWEEHVVVVTGEGWFRIGRPFDRTFPGGLRRVYPLGPVPDTGVLRRAVRYDLVVTPPKA